MGRFQNIIKLLEERSYINVLVTFFELTAIFTSLLYIRKDKVRVLFLLYLLFDLNALLYDFYVETSDSITGREASRLILFTNTLVCGIELIVYYHFFISIIQNTVIIRLMKIIRVLFIA